MIRRDQEMRTEYLKELRGGNGDVQIVHYLEKAEFKGKGRLFAKNILKPGASIGQHQHVGEFETYYILKGEATVNNNGVWEILKPGDVLYTDNGESHSIENTGTTDLEFIALIIFD